MERHYAKRLSDGEQKVRVKDAGRQGEPELFPLGVQGREASVQSVVGLINL